MNIVFDIGNVLLRWDPQALLQGLGFSASEQNQLLADVVHTPEWLALDRGDVSLDEAVAASARRLGWQDQRVREIYLGVGPTLRPITPFTELALSLAAAGHKIFVLSNMPEQTWKHLEETYSFFNEFNGLLLSFQENLIKPEAAIYKRLLQRFKLQADLTVFVDDQLPNIEAARACGIAAVHLVDPDQPEPYRDALLAEVQKLQAQGLKEA